MNTKLMIVLTFLLVSCRSQETSTIPTIDVLAGSGSEISNLSEIATNVEYIPLETSEECPTGFFNDLKSDSSRIYIYQRPEFYCFSKNGKFLFKLTKAERGPEIFENVQAWDICPEYNLLMILTRGKIVLYNNTGTGFVYLKSISFSNDNVSKANFVPGTNKILLSNSSSGNNVLQDVLINFDGDTLNVRPNYYRFTHINNSGFSSLTFKYNNLILFKNIMSDSVFTIGLNNKIDPYLLLNTNGMYAKPETFDKLLKDPRSLLLSYLKYNFIIEVPRYIMYSFRKVNAEFSSYGIFDKSSNKEYEIHSETHSKDDISGTINWSPIKYFLKDDISGGINFIPDMSIDNKLYSMVYAAKLKAYVSSEDFKNSIVKNPEKKQALETLANSLKDTDNPVLIVVTPKDLLYYK